MKWRHRVIWNR